MGLTDPYQLIRRSIKTYSATGGHGNPSVWQRKYRRLMLSAGLTQTDINNNYSLVQRLIRDGLSVEEAVERIKGNP